MSFVVKDTEKFQSTIIPKFFKHNKISSFVRQLNFYGFRKVRSEPLRLEDAEAGEVSRFHHDKFRRNRPDLLAEIRKSNQNESADKQEVEALKQQVSALNRRVSDMSKDVDGLKALVGTLIRSQHLDHQTYAPEIPRKKLKLSHDGPLAVPSNADTLSDSSAAIADPAYSEALLTKDIRPVEGNVRNESTGLASFTSQDEEMLTSLFALDPLDEIDVIETEGRPSVPKSMSHPSTNI